MSSWWSCGHAGRPGRWRDSPYDWAGGRLRRFPGHAGTVGGRRFSIVFWAGKGPRRPSLRPCRAGCRGPRQDRAGRPGGFGRGRPHPCKHWGSGWPPCRASRCSTCHARLPLAARVSTWLGLFFSTVCSHREAGQVWVTWRRVRGCCPWPARWGGHAPAACGRRHGHRACGRWQQRRSEPGGPGRAARAPGQPLGFRPRGWNGWRGRRTSARGHGGDHAQGIAHCARAGTALPLEGGGDLAGRADLPNMWHWPQQCTDSRTWPAGMQWREAGGHPGNVPCQATPPRADETHLPRDGSCPGHGSLCAGGDCPSTGRWRGFGWAGGSPQHVALAAAMYGLQDMARWNAVAGGWGASRQCALPGHTPASRRDPPAKGCSMTGRSLFGRLLIGLPATAARPRSVSELVASANHSVLVCRQGRGRPGGWTERPTRPARMAARPRRAARSARRTGPRTGPPGLPAYGSDPGHPGAPWGPTLGNLAATALLADWPHVATPRLPRAGGPREAPTLSLSTPPHTCTGLRCCRAASGLATLPADAATCLSLPTCQPRHRAAGMAAGLHYQGWMAHTGPAPSHQPAGGRQESGPTRAAGIAHFAALCRAIAQARRGQGRSAACRDPPSNTTQDCDRISGGRGGLPGCAGVARGGPGCTAREDPGCLFDRGP